MHSSKERKVGIVYHPHIARAAELSTMLSSALQADWVCSSEEVGPDLSPVSLVVSIGGDGTILRLARAFLSARIPLVGVNVGSLGFLTEVSVDEMLKLPELIKSGGWIDERSMLQVNLGGETFHILNDVVVARGEIPEPQSSG